MSGQGGRSGAMKSIRNAAPVRRGADTSIRDHIRDLRAKPSPAGPAGRARRGLEPSQCKRPFVETGRRPGDGGRNQFSGPVRLQSFLISARVGERTEGRLWVETGHSRFARAVMPTPSKRTFTPRWRESRRDDGSGYSSGKPALRNPSTHTAIVSGTWCRPPNLLNPAIVIAGLTSSSRWTHSRPSSTRPR